MATSRRQPPPLPHASHTPPYPVDGPEQARGDDRDDARRGELSRQALLPADPDQPGQVLGERMPGQVAIQPGAPSVGELGGELRMKLNRIDASFRNAPTHPVNGKTFLSRC